MRDSPFPAVIDTEASVQDVNEATDILCANVPNEHAAMIEAIERVMGITPKDLGPINYGAFADVAALLLGRLRFEVREYTHLNSDGTQKAVSFATSRFTVAPKVFLFPRESGAVKGDDTFAVYSVSTTGFTSVRNTANDAPSTIDIDMAYLAIEWDPPALTIDDRITASGDNRITASGDNRITA